MPTEKELHDRFDALEKRLKDARSELGALDDQRRMDIGDLLEALSGAMDDHEEKSKG